MKKSKIVIVIVVLIIITGCIIYSKQSNSIDILKIGAILPLTGKEATAGESMKNAIELAVDDINKRGGINTKKVSVIYEDSQSDSKRGLAAYTKLTKTDNVKVILTSVSGVTLAVAPNANSDKVLILSIGTAATQISDAGDYIFRHNLMPADEIDFLAKYLISKNIKDVPVLVTNSEAGVSYYDFFKKDYEALGGKIALTEKYEKGSIDFKIPLLKIKSSGLSNVVDLAYASEMGIMFKQAKELGMTVQWYGAYTTEDNQTIKLAGPTANGVIYTHFYNPDIANPLHSQYLNSYLVKYGVEPNSYSGLAYDFVKILLDKIKMCDDINNTVCIKDGLYKTKNYEGVTGKISFDQNGDTRKEIILKTIKDQKFVKFEE